MAVVNVATDASAFEKRLVVRIRRRMDLLSAVVMAAATVATAYSAYQSSRWNSQETTHKSRSATAVVRVGKLSNLALQRTSVHVNLFVHWLSAVNKEDRRLADFLFIRFPEPLKSATEAWRSTNPFATSEGPASPFDMPQYVLQERVEADRWEQVVQDESAAAEKAGETASRYLLFTILYASVLFFGGISGKFRWPALDLTVLLFGALTLLAGVASMIASPRL